MGIPSVTISYNAVLIGTIIHILLGMIWYSRFGFGDIWMKLTGISEKDMKKAQKAGMGSSYLMMVISSFVIILFLEYFVVLMTAQGFVEGLRVGVMLWIGFIATTMLGSVLWEGKPVKAYILNSTYYFASLGIVGGLLASW
ncbi:hypothetical protein COU54_04235 [Candidatus Pacearchaeota archaeon CG10_big_fil_rev_8_21_14_0_10_31_24]|nr:MAG: hypothetical protein COU54_04235 [Candidatus Pacearchaeota archaeon CG10_big_fil_rev_8_21_14_0_10_31_24]